MIRKRLLSAYLALTLCLSLLPATALAAGEIELYVAGQRITESGCYANQDGTWTKVDGTEPASGQFYYDAATATLTLNQAEISYDSTLTLGTKEYYGSVIAYSPSADVSLNIVVSQGTSTITGNGGIRVMSEAGDASLSISGPGSLEVKNVSNDSGIVLIGSKNVNLGINSADVTISDVQYYGVNLAAGDECKSTATINDGNLTASGSTVGIYFMRLYNDGPSSLTVSGNAMVDTEGSTGGIINGSPDSFQIGADGESGGIVFNGKSGTVYGKVELQDDLTINEGETLTVGKDASLTVPDGKTLTNNGTINVESGGKLEGTTTGNGTLKIAPTITTQPQDVEVKENETATFNVKVTGTEPLSYQWQQSTDNGQSWTDIDGATNDTYSIEATITSMSGYQYRCVVTSASGVSVTSAAATLTVNDPAPTTYTITADVDPVEAGTVTVNGSGTSASVAAGSPVTLNAAANEGYRFTGWMENDQQVSTNATYTFNANGDRTLTAKFEKKVTGVTLNTETLELFTGGSATLTATVEPSDAANQNVTWQSDNANVATVEGGTVTAVSAGTATITVTTEDGAKTATCTVTVSRYSSGGGSTTYAITATDAENGTVRVSPSRASRGTTVTITVTPDEGYELETISVLDSRDNEITLTDKGDGKYTFTMPAGRVTVEASFAEIVPEPLPFGDVDDGDWFADAVRFVYENGMMNGVSETSFAPHAATSRSMIVTILYRLEGEPVVDDAMDFTDVAGDAYYAEAVRWAASEGIVGGYGGGLFGADDAVTREQLAVILYRYAVYKGYDVSIGEDTNILSYADFADLSEYAIPAMQWACGAGIVNGTSESTLAPQGEATRAQVAAMLMRFCEAIG